ncbi:MAG: hypothetical protein RID91_10495 [Azospirillaceae bacterium]
MRLVTALLAALAVGLPASQAFAYIGPGAGITLIGSVLGLAAALILALGMTVAWPLRAWRRQRRARATAGRDAGAAE